jgi:hemerythrin-like domain-containing protein
VEREYEQMLELVEGVEKRLDDGDREGAVDALTALARQLRAHDRKAENNLFPVAERSGDGKALAGLRREHRAFQELIREIERGLDIDSRYAVAGDLRELEVALRVHLEHEERVLAACA